MHYLLWIQRKKYNPGSEEFWKANCFSLGIPTQREARGIQTSRVRTGRQRNDSWQIMRIKQIYRLYEVVGCGVCVHALLYVNHLEHPRR